MMEHQFVQLAANAARLRRSIDEVSLLLAAVAAQTANKKPRIFQLIRHEDETGVSGTGIVAEGCEFTNGTCALTWLTEYTSVAIYPDITTIEKIHGHHGKTEIRFITPTDTNTK